MINRKFMGALDMPKNHWFKMSLLASATLLAVGCSDSGNSQSQSKASEQAATSTAKPEQKVEVEKQGIDIWPTIESAVKTDPKVEQRVADIMATMTLEHKIAQMIQPEIRDVTVEDMRQYGFGSYLNGGGSFPNTNKHSTPADWIKLAEDMYQASIDDSLDGSTIPTMWGTDAVHGHNNVIGATLFPHNIGLGAANNPQLIEKIALATAKEVMVTGIDWVFAPTVAVVRNDRWGRTYEGYSEDPEIVREYARSIVTGLQGKGDSLFTQNRVISTVKHFVGDGGTVDGDDQGDNIATEQQLFGIHAQGYVGGLEAGAQSVMASFNSWHGKKNHGNKYLLTDVLKTKMGFDGFVVGDWNGHGQVKGCTVQSCPQSINAGLDIFMVPGKDWKPLYDNTIAQVKAGEIAMSRIDDAVARILRVKVRAGLFEKLSPANRPLSGKTELIGAAEHRAIARQAVRESLVLLKNNDKLLPLSPKANILLAGDGADNIGKQSGGWTITWQGTGNNNDDFPGGTSIYDGFKRKVEAAGGRVQLSVDGQYQQKPDVAVVVFGEEPYAEGNGDIDNLDYQRGVKSDLALLKKLKSDGIPVVSIFISGRPMWVNAELNASDAFVAAWLPGSEGVGIADVLLTKANGEIDFDFKGKLSFSWPRSPIQTEVNRHDKEYNPLIPYGFGLKYGEKSILPNDLNEVFEYKQEAIQATEIFAGNVKAPWQLYLSDERGRTMVTSNVTKQGAVQMRTVDRRVQEDARRLSFNGTDLAKVGFSANFPEDLRALSQSDSALVFDVKIEKAPTAAVNLDMHCEIGCKNSVALTEKFNQLSANQWHTVSVDLACFDADLSRLAKVIVPIEFSTQGQLDFAFSDVKLMPNMADKAVIQCGQSVN